MTAVQAVLDEFNRGLRMKDQGLAKRFHKTAIFVGSEPGELARGRDELTQLFGAMFQSPATVQFEWASVEANSTGDTAWFYAEGTVVIVAPDREQRRPYALTGVIEKGRQGWRWRLFHGSEPWIEPPASH